MSRTSMWRVFVVLLLLTLLTLHCGHVNAQAKRKKTRGKKRAPKINLDHKHMIELELDTFEESVTSVDKTPWMVMFYQFRDPNSQKYMPAYERLATGVYIYFLLFQFRDPNSQKYMPAYERLATGVCNFISYSLQFIFRAHMFQFKFDPLRK